MSSAGNQTLRLGTRKSQLALWQTNHVTGLLGDVHPDVECEQVTFETVGDLTLDKPLPEIGGKGLFTQELEHALRSERIDVAVHSLKDLPTEEVEGLTIGAICERMDPRDVFISGQYDSIAALPEGATVGTSSTRRAAQLLAMRPDLNIESIRGNVDTRVRKASDGTYDGILLAAAGVIRIGLADAIKEYLEFETMLPAPGQGAVAVQCRAGDSRVLEILSAIDHRESRVAVTAERAFLHGLGGGCSTPVGAHATVAGGQIQLVGIVAALDGQTSIGVERSGSLEDADHIGAAAAQDALSRGAKELLQ